MKSLWTIILLGIVALPVASAQTAPDLIVFEAGTPIKAAEVNANFQLLRDQIAAAIGTGDVTLDDLEELAAIVDQLQTAFEAGELDGANLEYRWDGTRLGVRQSGESDFSYVELRGAVGPEGPKGAAGEDGVDGAPGADGKDGAPGANGEDGAPGAPGADGVDGVDGAPGAPGADGNDGLDGRNIEYTWDGTQLGIRYEGETSYDFENLQGPIGPRGEKGEPGAPGVDGEDGAAGIDGVDGSPGAPGSNGEDGQDGADGRTLLNGTGAPGSSLGADGDFYIDTASWSIYGPKASDWGSAVSLVGPTGPEGEDGSDGSGGIDSSKVVIRTTHVPVAAEPYGTLHSLVVACADGEVLMDVTAYSPDNPWFGWSMSVQMVDAVSSNVYLVREGTAFSAQVQVKCLVP